MLKVEQTVAIPQGLPRTQQLHPQDLHVGKKTGSTLSVLVFSHGEYYTTVKMDEPQLSAVPVCSCDCARLQALSFPWDPALSIARQVGHAAWLLHNCLLSDGGELACLLFNTKQVQPLALCPSGSSCHLWGLKTEARAACCVLSHTPSCSNPLSLRVDSVPVDQGQVYFCHSLWVRSFSD